MQGAEHAVAMQFDFPAERFGEPFEGLVLFALAFFRIGSFECHCVR